MTNSNTTSETDTGTNTRYCELPPPPPPMASPPREGFDPKESIPPSLSTSPTSSNEELITNASSAAFSTSMSSLTSSSTLATPTPTQTKKAFKTKTVDLLHLASTTLASTIIASKIIQKHSLLLSSSPTSSATNRNHSERKSMPAKSISKTRIKDDGSIVTDADGESQRIITSYIRSISSQIRIVGEESNDEIQISHVEYQRTVNSWFGVGDIHNNDNNINKNNKDVANAYANTGCVSPGSKRKLLKKEKVDEDYICDYVKMEIESRYRNYLTEMKTKKEKVAMKKSDCNKNDDGHPHFEGRNDNGNSFDHGHAVHVDPSRVSVYVDPLDGTSAYAKGHYEAVTVLAGIMLDNVPIFGIIVKPFGHEGYNINFQEEKQQLQQHTQEHQIQQEYHSNDNNIPSRLSSLSTAMGFQFPCSAMYGGTLIGGAFILGGNELNRSRIHRTQTAASSLSPQATPSLSLPTTTSTTTTTNQYSQRKAIISKSRGGGVVRQCIDSLSSKGLLDPEPIYITGAGYKTMRLVLGTSNETMWFFPKPGTSLWDVAAADALLRVIGGRISDKFGNDLDYSKSRADANNLDGIIACSDFNLHKKCIQLYHDECWDDEDDCT